MSHMEEEMEVNYADCSFITPDGDLREICDWCDIIIFMVDLTDELSVKIVELLLTQVVAPSCGNCSSFLLGEENFQPKSEFDLQKLVSCGKQIGLGRPASG